MGCDSQFDDLNASVAKSTQQTTRTGETTGLNPAAGSKYILNKEGSPICKFCLEPIRKISVSVTEKRRWYHTYYMNSPMWRRDSVPPHPHEILGIPVGWAEPLLESDTFPPTEEKSLGLNEEQRNIIAKIVKIRINVDTYQKEIRVSEAHIKESKEKLKQIENEFEEIKKEIEVDGKK